MRLIVEGKKAEKKLRYTYELLDRHNSSTNTHSMARTTGYTATLALRMIAHKVSTIEEAYPHLNSSANDRNLSIICSEV